MGICISLGLWAAWTPHNFSPGQFVLIGLCFFVRQCKHTITLFATVYFDLSCRLVRIVIEIILEDLPWQFKAKLKEFYFAGTNKTIAALLQGEAVLRSTICIIVFTVFHYLSEPGADFSGTTFSAFYLKSKVDMSWITFIRACSMTRANPVNIYRIIQNVPHIFPNPGKSGSTSHMFCIIKYKGCLYTVRGGGLLRSMALHNPDGVCQSGWMWSLAPTGLIREGGIWKWYTGPVHRINSLERQSQAGGLRSV